MNEKHVQLIQVALRSFCIFPSHLQFTDRVFAAREAVADPDVGVGYLDVAALGVAAGGDGPRLGGYRGGERSEVGGGESGI